MNALQKIINRSKQDREGWRYTPLEQLLVNLPTPLPCAVSNANAAPQDDTNARLIFVNGTFEPKKSRFGSIPSCILMGDSESGYKLTLGEHTCLVAQPIDMVFMHDGQTTSVKPVKMAIEIGANGRLTLLEHHMAGTYPTLVETTVSLHERAKFVHGKMISGGAHIAHTSVDIANGAYYNNFTLVRGTQETGLVARNELDVRLNGQEAQAALNGVMLLCGNEHADTTTCITHNAPQGSSRQVYKTVLADKAHGVFQGKIHVSEGAQKTDGYQLSRALLLSDQAEMDAKPELEIYADDVKCSHGCAIGDLDADALFYMRTRGLSEAQARDLLIGAFVQEMIDAIPVEPWRSFFSKEMEGWQS